MTSGETVHQDAGAAAPERVTGVVVVAHGGQSASTEPVTALQPAVLRMIPVAAAIRSALRGSGAVVRRPRFRVRGWNGLLASPVADLQAELDDIAAVYGPVPVVLVGHSMGARAAVRAAGHPAVSAVAGLAPWLPPGERPASSRAGPCCWRTGQPTASPARPKPGPSSSKPGRSPRWPRSRYATAITPCCAAPGSGTPSPPNSPAPPSACPRRLPPGWQPPSRRGKALALSCKTLIPNGLGSCPAGPTSARGR